MRSRGRSRGDPFYGQDAQYPKLEPSYQDNGDGTVSDLNTGLMWQKTTDAKRGLAGGPRHLV